MKTKKTDESVKAGLQLEADTNPGKRKRKRIPVKKDEDKEGDGDEILHKEGFEPTASFNKENTNELLHAKNNPNNEERDPDGLVHGR